MRKKVGIIKRLFTLLLVFLLSINSFAAIVSDNDGSAFITKAEFDALKSSFQSQIDSYNQSIDSKIDGAIASYLSGIKLTTREIKTVTLNAADEKLLFISKDTDPSLINFYGTMSVDVDSIAIAQETGTSTNLHGGQAWKSRADGRAFQYAMTYMGDKNIKLMKNVEIGMVCVNYNSSNYFSTPVAPSTKEIGFHHTANSNAMNFVGSFDNSVQNSFILWTGASGRDIYLGPTKLAVSGTKYYWTYDNYYVQAYPWNHGTYNWMPRNVTWNSYTDDNIKCLFSGESSFDSIACFKDPQTRNFQVTETIYLQANPSPYRVIDQAVQMYVLRSSFSKDVTEYDGTAYACTTWKTFDETTETNNAGQYKSFLPPMQILSYQQETDLTDFNGSAIKINDGYPFFTNKDKAGSLDFELQCVTSYGSNWTVFVTSEPMQLSDRTTTKAKVNIKKQGDPSYTHEITWTSTSPLRLTMETEKDKTYYIYVMNTTTGKSPIFKFAATGEQTIIHDET